MSPNQLTPKWYEGPKLAYGLIFAMLLHAFSVVWWASDMTSRVGKLETHVVDTKNQSTEIARLQENSIYIKESLTEIKLLLRTHTSPKL
jgi:hypothetical protein